MKLIFRHNYEGLTDRELVEQATQPAEGYEPNGEAVAYLLGKRYAPLLKSQYHKVFDGRREYYDDCLDDLYSYLHEGESEWHKLKGIRWEGNFGVWLAPTAYRRFLHYKETEIDKHKNLVSTDDEDKSRRPKVQLPEGGKDEYEGNELRALVIEAITMLQNEDQRYAVIKQLRGYSSKEIALFIQERWKEQGIVRYGYRVVEGQERRQRVEVVPDEKYVDSLLQHARQELKVILTSLMK